MGMQINRCLSKESKQSLISPLSITRRAAKSISECIPGTPIISNGASKSNQFTRHRYQHRNSMHGDHWKLTNVDDYEDDDDEDDDIELYFDEEYPESDGDDVLRLHHSNGPAIARV